MWQLFDLSSIVLGHLQTISAVMVVGPAIHLIGHIMVGTRGTEWLHCAVSRVQVVMSTGVIPLLVDSEAGWPTTRGSLQRAVRELSRWALGPVGFPGARDRGPPLLEDTAGTAIFDIGLSWRSKSIIRFNDDCPERTRSMNSHLRQKDQLHYSM